MAATHIDEIKRYIARYGLFEAPDGLSGVVQYRIASAVATMIDSAMAAGLFYRQEGRTTPAPISRPSVVGAATLNLGDFGNPTNLANLRTAILAAGNRTVVIKVPSVPSGSTTSNGVVNFSSNGAGNACHIIVQGDGVGSIWNLGDATAFFNCLGSVVQFWDMRILLSTAKGGVVFGRDSSLGSINHSGIYNCLIDGAPTNPPVVQYGAELFSMRDTQVTRNNAGAVVSFDPDALTTFGGTGAGTSNTSSNQLIESCVFTAVNGAGGSELVAIGGTSTDMLFRSCLFNAQSVVDGAHPRVIALRGKPLEPSRQAIPRRILVDSCAVEANALIGVVDADGLFKEIWLEGMDARVHKGEVDFVGLNTLAWRQRIN